METLPYHIFEASNATGGEHYHRRMMMHMSFWGHQTEVLFSRWPRMSPAMYALALVFIFTLTVLVERLSHYKVVKPGTNDVATELVQATLYTVRFGADYMLILAVMSFNGGVFLMAVGGCIWDSCSLGVVLLGNPVCLARVLRDRPIVLL